MASETTLAQGLRATDARAQYDAACKRLLSEKIILAHIMKSCLEEYGDCDVNEIAEKYIEGQPQVGEVPVLPDESGTMIHGLDTEDKSLTEGTVTYDIRFYAIAPSSGEHIRLIINAEAQGNFYPGYSLLTRGIYYCSRMISSQYGMEFTDSHYEKIKKVYSIWICMNPPKNRENTITRYRMTEECLVGSAKELVQHYDLLSVIMVCLGNPDSGNYDGILKLLGTLLSPSTSVQEKQQILLEDFDIPMKDILDEEVSAMCNLSQAVEERGFHKGIQQGIQQGTEETILAAIQSLMETMHWSVDQSMAALKIPESQREKYLKLLQRA